ncbi:hypothetical protein H4219_005746, partial [Mycoemilia scoparia]
KDGSNSGAATLAACQTGAKKYGWKHKTIENEDTNIQQQLLKEIYSLVSRRPDTMCNFLDGSKLLEVITGGMVSETNINDIMNAIREAKLKSK